MKLSPPKLLLPKYRANNLSLPRNCLALLLMLLSPFIIFCQEVQTDCDTLILKNKKIMVIQIDSVINQDLYFKRCHSASIKSIKINITTIRKIQGPFASTEMYQNIINRKNITFEKDVPIKRSLLPDIKWVFEDSKGKKRILSSKSIYHLLVHNYQNTNKLIGYIAEISQQDITLITKKGEKFVIPKDKVDNIITPNPLRGICILLAAWFGTFGFIGFASAIEGGSWAGLALLMGIGFTGLTIVFALLAKQEQIEEPFSSKWKMEQVVEQKSVNASPDNQRP